MEAISEQRLVGLHPSLAAKVRAGDDALMAKTGGGIRVAEGLRSFADSDADYAKGRTVRTKPDGTPQGIVTNARGGESWHNYGLAVDCYPFVSEETGPLDWTASDPQFRAMIDCMKAQGLVAGADWHTIKDYPHFQLAGIPVSPTDADRAAYASGGVAAVWAQYSL